MSDPVEEDRRLKAFAVSAHMNGGKPDISWAKRYLDAPSETRKGMVLELDPARPRSLPRCKSCDGILATDGVCPPCQRKRAP